MFSTCEAVSKLWGYGIPWVMMVDSNATSGWRSARACCTSGEYAITPSSREWLQHLIWMNAAVRDRSRAATDKDDILVIWKQFLGNPLQKKPSLCIGYNFKQYPFQIPSKLIRSSV